MSRDTAVHVGAVDEAGNERPEAEPLSEIILSQLPGSRVGWFAVWLLVPWLNAGVTLLLQAADYMPPWENLTLELLSRTAFTLAIGLSLWGTARIHRGLRSLRSRLFNLVAETSDPIEPFGGIWSTTPPLLLTLGTVAVFGSQSALVHDSWPRTILTSVTWLLVGIALWTFIWVYLNLQIGLHRFGGFHLSLVMYPADRSLGLRPLGRLAFIGFWTLVTALAPLVLTTASNQLGLIIGVLVLLSGVALFFLSLRRLNRQMVAAKERELEWARHLYAEAFKPVQEERTLEALQRRSPSLSAAEALEKRAERIQEWPFDEATFTRVVTISSTVVAAITARMLLAPFGI